MMVVVTVIVALGLLIVMIIWWRKRYAHTTFILDWTQTTHLAPLRPFVLSCRQDAAGWEAAGPNPRSPSLNRFSDVELSIRSSN
jgi:hypothetical protein